MSFRIEEDPFADFANMSTTELGGLVRIQISGNYLVDSDARTALHVCLELCRRLERLEKAHPKLTGAA